MNVQTLAQIRLDVRKILTDNGVTPEFTDAQIQDSVQNACELLAWQTQVTKMKLSATFAQAGSGYRATVPESVLSVISVV